MELLEDRIDSFSQKVSEASTPSAIRTLLRLRTQIRKELTGTQSDKFDMANSLLMDKVRDAHFVGV